MDPHQHGNDGSQGSFPGGSMPAYQANWNSYMYGYQAPPPWYPPGMQQLPQMPPMMHPTPNSSQTFVPAENTMHSPQNPEDDVHEIPVPSDPTGKGKRTKGVGRTKLSNFSPEEDVAIVKSWLEISCDPITSTSQKKDGMWGKILLRYNLRRGSNPERSVRSLQSRWDIIKAEVGKFASIHADVIRENPSGMSDADKTTHAAANFAGILKHNFAYLHCWEIMKDEPKWQDPKSRALGQEAAGEGFGEDRVNLGDANADPTGSEEQRPMGRERAKARKKKGISDAASGSSSEYANKLEEMCLQRNAMMQEEHARKSARFLQISTTEDKRYEQVQRHNEALLAIEQEKVRLMREKQDKEREDQDNKEDERILAIDLAACFGAQREYYESRQADILEKVRRRNRAEPAP